MPVNGNIAAAVRDNIHLYLAARPNLRLREIAESCDLSYSGLSKLMATSSAVTSLSTETIDKLANGPNLPTTWLVASSGSEMAKMQYTGAKRLDEWIVHWAKHLFLGEAGYKIMRDHYAPDYYTTGFDPKCVTSYETKAIYTKRRDGFEMLGMGAEDEFRANHSTGPDRFFVKSARIVPTHHLAVTYESMTIVGKTRHSDSGACCLAFTKSIQEIIQNVPPVDIVLQYNNTIKHAMHHKK